MLEKQGHAIFGVDMKIVDDDGNELPWDGKTYGNLLVRGPWVDRAATSRRRRRRWSTRWTDGWFPTGDVATIDADGFMQITDRSKDVIKSGGEWISSIDLENIAMAHPAVREAAVHRRAAPEVGRAAAAGGGAASPAPRSTRDELLAFYEGKIAKWQMPDDVVFVDAIPLGATGKIQKMKLREQFKDHRLPTPEPRRSCRQSPAAARSG